MIKDGIWLESEADYRYYLDKCAEMKKKYPNPFKSLYEPLIKRARELLKERGIEIPNQ